MVLKRPRAAVMCLGLWMISGTPPTARGDGAADADPSSSVTTVAPRQNVAVLLYDGALLLDYGIAAEMFLAADFMRSFNVYTVAREPRISVSILGDTAVGYTLDRAPRADIVIVPGGPSWPNEASHAETVSYLRGARDGGAILFAICTGSLLLAKAGLLNDLEATVNLQATSMLAQMDPSITLHLVERVTSAAIARDLARRYLDYPYEPDELLASPD